MASILRTILFKEIQKPPSVGRMIKFDATDPDIRFATGSMHERVVGYMLEKNEPMTAKEIAQGVGSTTNRVYALLKRLVADRVLEVISVEGFHPEYLPRQRK